MKKNQLITVNIQNKRGKLLVSSRDIAKCLYKEHKDVLKKIEKVLAVGEFSEREFITTEGNRYKEYMLDKNAFILLVMNYTGYNDFKRAYIKRFDEMEKLIYEKKTPEWEQMRLTAKTSTKTLHDDIHDKFIPYAIDKGSKTYAAKPTLAYTHFDNPINKALGINKKDREQLSTINQNLLDIMNKSCSYIIDMEIDKDTDYHNIVNISKHKLRKIKEIFDNSEVV